MDGRIMLASAGESPRSDGYPDAMLLVQLAMRTERRLPGSRSSESCRLPVQAGRIPADARLRVGRPSPKRSCFCSKRPLMRHALSGNQNRSARSPSWRCSTRTSAYCTSLVVARKAFESARRWPVSAGPPLKPAASAAPVYGLRPLAAGLAEEGRHVESAAEYGRIVTATRADSTGRGVPCAPRITRHQNWTAHAAARGSGPANPRSPSGRRAHDNTAGSQSPMNAGIQRVAQLPDAR